MPGRPFPFMFDGITGDVPTNWIAAADPVRKIISYGTPGLKSICTLTGCTEIRGLWAWNNYLYAVARRGSQSVLWRIAPAGNYSELGTITTSFTGPVWMVNNNAQLLIADGVSGYTYTPATNQFLQITDPNFYGAAAADYQDSCGLLVQPNSFYWYLSALQDFTSYDGSRYSKEGSTDNIQGIMSSRLEVFVGGKDTTEIFQNTGGDNTSAATATFQRTPGGLLRYGWASAKAGCIFDNTAIWVTNQGQVVRVLGASPTVVSTDLMGRTIGKYPNFNDVTAFSFVDREHAFAVFNFPTGDETWVLDAKTNLFHKRTSYRDDGTGWGRWRANCYALLGSKHYVGDFSNGKIYEMSSDYYDDDGHVFPSIIYSQEVDGGQTKISFPPMQILMETGVGNVTDPGSDPPMMMESTKDGGKTWKTSRWSSMGKIGEYALRIVWQRMGMDYRRMYRFTVTDPVKRVLLGIDAEGKR
jgi:hypothetical protein